MPLTTRFTAGLLLSPPVPVSLLGFSSPPVPVSLLADSSSPVCYSRFTVGGQFQPLFPTRFTVGGQF